MNIENIENCKTGELDKNSFELSVNEHEYLQELFKSEEDWNNLSDSDKEEISNLLDLRISEVADMKGMDQTDIKGYAELPEYMILENKTAISNDNIEGNDSLEPIAFEELKKEYPELAGYLSEMQKRLGNNCKDGIMNTLLFYRDDEGAVVIKSSDQQYANSSIKIKGNDVYCNSGGRETDRHLNEFINEKKMMPNNIYHIDGDVYQYHTDSEGRVTKVTENYTQADIDDRVGDRGNLKPISDSKDGLSNDVGGHIVANNRAGMTEAINIVPMDSVFNNGGAWKSMESELCNAKENSTLQRVETELKYEGSSMRPTQITVTAVIDGVEKKYEYSNL